MFLIVLSDAVQPVTSLVLLSTRLLVVVVVALSPSLSSLLSPCIVVKLGSVMLKFVIL